MAAAVAREAVREPVDAAVHAGVWSAIAARQERCDALRFQSATRAQGSVPTPFRIAAAMATRLVRGVRSDRDLHVLDPGCGSGRLLVATLRAAAAHGARVACHGIELDAGVARWTQELGPRLRRAAGATCAGWQVEAGDFLAARLDWSGIDLVIANPPYVQRRALAAATRAELEARGYAGRADLAACFLEHVVRNLRPGGRLCVIVPNKLLAAAYAEPLRRLLLQRLRIAEIWDLSGSRVFPDHAAYPVVLVGQRGPSRRGSRVRIRDAGGRTAHTWSHAALQALPSAVVPLGLAPELAPLLERLRQCARFGDVVSLRCGIAVPGFARGIGHGDERILTTGDVLPFEIRRAQRFDLGRGGVAARAVAPQRCAKVVVPGMFRRLHAAYDDGGALLGRVYFVPIVATTPLLRRAAAAPLLALLNSRLYDVLYRGLFSGVAQSGGYLRLNAPYLNVLPWPDRPVPAELVALVAGLAAPPTPVERIRLDTLVDAWFGLAPAESAALAQSQAGATLPATDDRRVSRRPSNRRRSRPIGSSQPIVT